MKYPRRVGVSHLALGPLQRATAPPRSSLFLDPPARGCAGSRNSAGWSTAGVVVQVDYEVCYRCQAVKWLNANAAAVQAIAAIVSTAITVVLVAITWRYVRLTRDLALIARRQLELVNAARVAEASARRTRLDALISRLRAVRASLQVPPQHPERLLEPPLWSDAETLELHQLAAAVDATAAELARDAVGFLSGLRDLRLAAQDACDRGSLDWQRFPWDRWNHAHQGAERCLISLAAHLDRLEDAASSESSARP